MTLGFPSGSKNLCKLLWVSCEVFVLHGYDWIHWVPKSCTTIAYRWFTIFTENFVTCCCQITKIFCTKYDSTNASSARGPCNFGPLTDLAISVFREVSVNTLCLPKSALLVDVGSKDTSWEELACEYLCSGTLSSTNFFLWILATPGFQQTTGLPVLSGFPLHLGLGYWVAWQQTTGLPVLSSLQHLGLTQALDGIQIFPFSSLTVAWYCCNWWRRRAWGRCRMIALLS